MFKSGSIFFLVVLFPFLSNAQNLENLLTDSTTSKNDFVKSTFKTTRIVLGQSIESPPQNNLLVTISHHFGNISEGDYEFFGLTSSTIRLGLDYGITKRLSIGIGLSTYQKNLDGCIKYKILSQSSDDNMPVTVSYFGEIDETLLKWEYPERKDYLIYKISYANQLLIARKFNDVFSLQLSPTYIHYNLVSLETEQNNVFAIGAGGRFKITTHTSINFEYYYLLPGQTARDFNNAFSIGYDIETGGHVFQLFLTNSQPLFNRGFIAETSGSWMKGNICFGFNINRIFPFQE